MNVTWMDLFGRKLSAASAAAVVLSGALGAFCVLQLARVNQVSADQRVEYRDRRHRDCLCGLQRRSADERAERFERGPLGL